jgi:hypothetical protein
MWPIAALGVSVWGKDGKKRSFCGFLEVPAMDSSEETKPRQKRKTADITAKDDPFGRSEKDTDHKKKKLTAAQRTHERKISYVSKKYKRGSQADLSVRFCSLPL